MSSIKEIAERFRPDLSAYEDLYKHFHENLEISTQEDKTSATIESHLSKIADQALDIRVKIGGHGLIAICKNRPSPTVLLRADMDGMAVQEKTGLPYASKNTQKDGRDGQMKPVMHACGHDLHITSLPAATETLLAAREAWSGTLVALSQPAEETG